MTFPDHNGPSSYGEKVKSAEGVIRERLTNAKTPFVCFSGGKRSSALLHMVKKASPGRVNVLFIDTARQFDNIVQYTNKMGRLWNVNLCVERPESGDAVPDQGKGDCCRKLIGEPLARAISQKKIDLLFIGFNKDRTTGLVKGLCGGIGDIAAYPLWHFTDDDVRRYIMENKIPVCSLYEKGYLTVDCSPCSMKASEEKAEDEALVKEKLRKLGYL